MRSLLRRPLLALYALVLAAAMALCFRAPIFNFDLVPYLGSVLALEGASVEEAHGRTYREAQRVLSPAAFGDLIASPPPAYVGPAHARYRHDLYTSAALFGQQLPYYRVKPAYLVAVLTAHKLGAGLVTAPYVVGCLAFGAFGLLLFLWIASRTNDLVALLVATPFVLMANTNTLARAASPDMLSSAAVLAAGWAWAASRSIWLPAVLGVCAVLVRPDTAIEFGVVLPALEALDPGRLGRRRDLVRAAVPAALALATYAAVNASAHAYPWPVLFWTTCVEPLSAPRQAAVHLTAGRYVGVVVDAWQQLADALASAPALLGLLALARLRTVKSSDSRFVLAMLAAVVARFLLLPGANYPLVRLLLAPLLLLLVHAVGVLARPYERAAAAA